ncbi:MAG: hypothetical protein AAF433_17445 [Bacteroidota bacterium]
MPFQLIPIIDRMLELYAQPRSAQRFEEYLAMLREHPKGDMVLPIAAYNPMAKDQVVGKLHELKELGAEKLMTETLSETNLQTEGEIDEPLIDVVLNLADDLLGGWTNRYTTDYDSKFKIHAFVSRNFCTPFFWTSEDYSAELIQSRTRQYAFRTLYWLRKRLLRPRSLQDHLEQEIYVATHCPPAFMDHESGELDILRQFYQTHRASEDYSLIFNFFYGDAASQSLGFTTYGLSQETTGFDFARAVASKLEW